jgi:hypothetical protein
MPKGEGDLGFCCIFFSSQSCFCLWWECGSGGVGMEAARGEWQARLVAAEQCEELRGEVRGEEPRLA